MTDTDTDSDAHTTGPAQGRQDVPIRLNSFRLEESLVLFGDDDDRWIQSDAAVDLADVR